MNTETNVLYWLKDVLRKEKLQTEPVLHQDIETDVLTVNGGYTRL
jgi:hypothetical protein